MMIKVSMPSDPDSKISIGQETGGRMTQVWNTGDRIAVISLKENAAQKVAVFELHGKGGSTDGLFRHIRHIHLEHTTLRLLCFHGMAIPEYRMKALLWQMKQPLYVSSTLVRLTRQYLQ